jgi:hypothetical protein
VSTFDHARALAASYGATLIHDEHPHDTTAGEVWAPKGSVWALSMTHVLVAHSLSCPDPWAQLAEDMARGLVPCPSLNCEVCARAF